MNNFQYLQIVDVCKQVYSGGTPNRKHDEYYKNGTIPWLNTGEIVFNRITKTENYITEEGYAKSSAKWVPENSVIVAMYGASAARVAINKIRLTTNQACCNLVINPDIADYRYVYYYLCTQFEKLSSLANGGAQQNLNAAQIKEYPIPLPELKKQKAVADILSLIDDKIELNNKINDNLSKQARALFKEWFLDTDASIGWEEVKLKDFITLKRNSIKCGDNTSIPYLPIDIIPMNNLTITEVKPNEEAQSSLITFDKDDILIGAMRVYFHRVVLSPINGITRSTCFVLSPKDSDYLAYSLLLCDLDSTIDYAQGTSKGSTMPYAVWDGGLGDMKVPLPPKEKARSFNGIVLPMLRRIQKTFFENKSLSELRDSLLPKLMSGEIDVNSVEL